MILNMIDFDGTLVFTERALYLAYKKAFKKYTKFNLTETIWHDNIGKTYKEIANQHGIFDKKILKKVHKYKYDIYPKNYFDEIEINDAMFAQLLLDYNKEVNVIVTHTNSDVVEEILHEFDMYLSHFYGIYDRSILQKIKPSPQMYLNAYSQVIEEYKIEIINIYEDSYPGIMAGKKALQLLPDTLHKMLFKVDRTIIEPMDWR